MLQARFLEDYPPFCGHYPADKKLIEMAKKLVRKMDTIILREKSFLVNNSFLTIKLEIYCR